MKRFILWVFLVSSAYADTSYVLGSMDSLEITLDNQSVFQTEIFYQQVISDWSSGDVLKLSHEFPPFSFFPSPQFRDGLPIVAPIVHIHNPTKNSAVIAHLIAKPTTSLVRVTSVNLSSNIVTLSDATSWEIPPEDGIFLNVWNVNDEVLIGYNNGLQHTIFESALLNARQQSFVKAHQQ